MLSIVPGCFWERRSVAMCHAISPLAVTSASFCSSDMANNVRIRLLQMWCSNICREHTTVRYHYHLSQHYQKTNSKLLGCATATLNFISVKHMTNLLKYIASSAAIHICSICLMHPEVINFICSKLNWMNVYWRSWGQRQFLSTPRLATTICPQTPLHLNKSGTRKPQNHWDVKNIQSTRIRVANDVMNKHCFSTPYCIQFCANDSLTRVA